MTPTKFTSLTKKQRRLSFTKIKNKKEGVKSPSFFIAKLKSPLPSIKVELEGLELDKDDFLVSSSVVVNHTTGQNVMNKGDKVLLVVVNGTYILIDKVVNV